MNQRKKLFNEFTKERKIDMVKTLQKFNLPDNMTFLHCGTLLGSIRDGALIEHDDDFDIAYLSNYHTKEEIRNEMLDIYRYLNSKGMLLKYFDLNYKDVMNYEIGKFGLGQAHVKIDDIVFDLWTTWIDEDGDFNLFDMNKISKTILPLSDCSLYGVKFKAPRNSEEILSKIYGNDWMIPIIMKPSNDGKYIQLKEVE